MTEVFGAMASMFGSKNPLEMPTCNPGSHEQAVGFCHALLDVNQFETVNIHDILRNTQGWHKLHWWQT